MNSLIGKKTSKVFVSLKPYVGLFGLIFITLNSIAPVHARQVRLETECSKRLIEATASNDAQRLYGQFLEHDYPLRLRSKVVLGISQLRTTASATERQRVLREFGNRFVNLVRELYGVEEVGLHFNHHGGAGKDYVQAGGILARRGDITNAHVHFGGNLHQNVYFFGSSAENPADSLGHPNSDLGFLSAFSIGRMGDVISVFGVDSPSLKKVRAEGGIISRTGAAINFKPEWLEKNSGVGIPYSSYLFPPIKIFGDFQKRYPELGKIRRDEETLIALILITEIARDRRNWIGPSWDWNPASVEPTLPLKLPEGRWEDPSVLIRSNLSSGS